MGAEPSTSLALQAIGQPQASRRFKIPGYVSAAGGAFLEWMEGKPLPGVEVLKV
jgi:3-phosphoglycerate kinase